MKAVRRIVRRNGDALSWAMQHDPEIYLPECQSLTWPEGVR
jgi:hypothetical protein